MSGYFYTGFVGFMLKDKSLLEYTNLDNIKIFSLTKKVRWKKSVVLFLVSIENSKTLKHQLFSKKQ